MPVALQRPIVDPREPANCLEQLGHVVVGRDAAEDPRLLSELVQRQQGEVVSATGAAQHHVYMLDLKSTQMLGT